MSEDDATWTAGSRGTTEALEVEEPLDEGEVEPEGSLEPPDWVTQVEKYERSIYELHRRYAQGRMDLQPDFQREFVWDRNKQVRLVESVLAKVPLPAFFFSDESDRLLVIDGQQRLTTLFRYLDGGFPTETSRLLDASLHHMRFEQLPPLMQRRFEDAPLICFVVQRRSSPRFKFELFERLNQGATVLTPQEIRNAIYRGRGLDAITAFVQEDKLFQELVRKRRKLGRGKDRELVLRSIALQWQGVEKYRGSLKRFLNDTLELLNREPADRIAEILARFSRALRAAAEVFGVTAFDSPKSSRLSVPVMDVLIQGFVQAEDLAPWGLRAARLRAQLESLWQDPAFQNAVSGSTDRREKLLLRLEMWRSVLSRERQGEGAASC